MNNVLSHCKITGAEISVFEEKKIKGELPLNACDIM
jgi:hypothetical protein